jgi:hypothetical protein
MMSSGLADKRSAFVAEGVVKKSRLSSRAAGGTKPRSGEMPQDG